MHSGALHCYFLSQPVPDEVPRSMPTEETIDLDQFLKLCRAAETGGHAKVLIQSGEVKVNGEVETRRRRKLRNGDQVEYDGETYVIETD